MSWPLLLNPLFMRYRRCTIPWLIVSPGPSNGSARRKATALLPLTTAVRTYSFIFRPSKGRAATAASKKVTGSSSASRNRRKAPRPSPYHDSNSTNLLRPGGPCLCGVFLFYGVSGRAGHLKHAEYNRGYGFNPGCQSLAQNRQRPGLDAIQLYSVERVHRHLRPDRLHLVAAGRGISGAGQGHRPVVAVHGLAADRQLRGDVAADHGRGRP